MANEFVDLPTDILVELAVAMLEVGKPLSSADGAQLEKLRCELQGRMETQSCVC